MATDHSTAPVEYRDAPGYPGYRVGDDGSVWYCGVRKGRRGQWGGSRMILDPANWHRINPGRTPNGYANASMRNAAGRRLSVSVHALVLLAFVGPRPHRHVARHLNGIKSDNRLANLAWGTHAENFRDRDEHGKTTRGSRHWAATLTESQVTAILELHAAGTTRKAILDRFPMSLNTYYRVVNRVSWRHVTPPESPPLLGSPLGH